MISQQILRSCTRRDKGVWVSEFLPHDISSHDTFLLHPDPNHNLIPNPFTNPGPNPNSPLTVTSW